MSELKPCPFCGGSAEVLQTDFDHPHYMAKCASCSSQTAELSPRERAVAVWNNSSGRSAHLEIDLDQQRKLLHELMKRIRELGIEVSG